jgi:cell wall assembly regulator SMI1
MTTKASIDNLDSLLLRLQALRRAIDSVEDASPGDRSTPYPPASEREIAAHEKRLRFALPPSYRAFLTIHNGWRNFSYDWSILGVSGPGFERAHREWTREAEKFARQVKRRKDLENISEKSKKDPSVISWPDHVPLAVDYNGGFRIFDRNRGRADGEYDIAEVYSGSEEALNRERDFLAIVNLAIEIARRELSAHGRNPKAIEANALKSSRSKSSPEASSNAGNSRKARPHSSTRRPAQKSRAVTPGRTKPRG